MEPSLRRGQLTKWKDDRGFGFIQPVDGSQEVFLHISSLKDATRRPQIGDTIYYHVLTDKDDKISACNAFILGARNKQISSSIYLNKETASRAVDKYSFPIVEMLLLSSLPLVGSIHFVWTTANPIPLILYPVASLLTFALYANDKSRAKRGDWRISEQTLHLCEFAGGWLGGFIAQRKLRHKSIKSSYQLVFWVIVTLHLVFWLDWLLLGGILIKTLLLLSSSFRR